MTIVTLEEKGQTSIELVPLTPLHDLRQIEGELECLLSKEVLEQGDAKDYLRVILTDKTMPYDAIGQLRQAYPNVLRIDFAQEQGQTASSDTAADRVEEQTPLELFASFYEMANEETMTDEEIAILKAALQKLEENAP